MKRFLIYLFIILLIPFLIAFGYIYLFDDVDKEIITEIEHEENSFFKIGDEEGEVIRELITTMAHNNPAVLAFKKSKLESLGARLRHKVNTFEFLVFVFSNQDLADDMKLLKESSIKYKRFVEGLSQKMLKEYERDDFYLRVEHFAKHLKLDYAVISLILNSCVETGKAGDRIAFKPLIDYLIASKAH
jgi:hypothetical protein